MSTSYTLALTRDTGSPSLVSGELRLMVAQVGWLSSDPGLADPAGQSLTLSSGLHLDVAAVPPQPIRDSVSVDFGIDTATKVIFSNGRTDDQRSQVQQIVWLTLSLLARLPGDALLRYGYEAVLLVRRGDEMLLGDDDEFWTPELLALVPQPFRRTRLTFSDD